MNFIVKGRTLQSDITRYIDPDEVKKVLEIKDTPTRIGKVSYLIHDAIVKSSISFYSGGTFFFNGQHYVFVTKEDFSNAIYTIIRKIGVPEGDIVFRGREILRIAYVGVQDKQLEYNPNKICFANGVLDIKTKEFSNFSEKHHIFGAVKYNYNANLGYDDAYLWHRFLEEVLPDIRQRRMLQEYLGLLFVNRRETNIEAMLFMIGKGSNGKSVIFNTITNLIGRDNVSNFDISALTSHKDRLLNVAIMNGKRLNYCSDFGSKKVDDEAFKSLTAGEPQPARRQYGNPFMAYDIPFIIGNGNKMPPTSDLSNGFFRRVLILPFNVEIPIERQNRNLSFQLESEYSAIFNWILEGKDRLMRNNFKFSQNEITDAAIREYRENASNVFQWLNDRSFRYTGEQSEVRRWLMARYLYDNYEQWCRKFNEVAQTMRAWGTTMQDIGYQKCRFSNGNAYLVYGIKDGKFTNGIIKEEMPPEYMQRMIARKDAEIEKDNE